MASEPITNQDVVLKQSVLTTQVCVCVTLFHESSLYTHTHMCKHSHGNISIRQDSMYKSKYLTQCVQKWEGPLDPCAHDTRRPHHILVGEQSRLELMSGSSLVSGLEC